MWIHLIMMVVLAIMSIGVAIFLLTNVASRDTAEIATLKTSIIFGAILAMDLIFGILFNSQGNAAAYRFVSVLPRLLMDGTIGLAIKGKYDDKDARGTI